MLDVRTVRGARGTELYLAAAAHSPAFHPAEAYRAIVQLVNQHGARICAERTFVPTGQRQVYEIARRSILADMADQVPVNWLSAGAERGVGGIQVHAIAGRGTWQPLRDSAGIRGWCYQENGNRWAVASPITPPLSGRAGEARGAFEAAEALLAQAEMDLRSVARTWLFLDDILSWYGEFNRIRNALFIERGLLCRGQAAGAVQVPASTGMGVGPLGGHSVALEVCAATGPGLALRRHAALGRQRCAYEYGSAFARASELLTPGGRTVYVSGTAAIDTAGHTCFVNDAPGQIRMTLNNILAVLRDTACPPSAVVRAIAYCKTPDVAAAFVLRWQPETPWPWIVVIGDVCRDDLLFEAEVTGCHAG